jgi:hypothetical protein
MAFAQLNQGSITGTVNDPTGAVVPNASIAVRNTNTGASFSAGATSTGNFVVPVPAGSYEMTVAVPGFKTFVQTGIPVVEGTATRRDVQLQIGQVSEVLTITDTAPLLKTESGDVSYRVQSNLVNQIPVLNLSGTGGALGNIRNPLSMATVVPGVNYNPNGFQTMVVNGLPANSQTVMIDGQDASPTLWRGVSTDRSQGGVDAIEALTMQTSNFAAEFGKTGGALFNYTMKSGGNSYHGTVYNYFVNEFLNAGTPYTDWTDQNLGTTRYNYKAGQQIRNRQRRNDWGFTFGGPIKIPGVYEGKDKSFFFFNLEQFRETSRTATNTVTVPTLAYRQGDFSSAGCNTWNVATQNCDFRQQITAGGVQAVDPAGNLILNGGIYDPSSYRLVNGAPTRTLYPNQRVPLASFDRVAKNIQDLFPLPSNNALTQNYVVPAFDLKRTNTIPSIKLDQNLNSKMRLSGYWGQTITNQNTTGNQGFDTTAYPWSSTQINNYHNHTIRVSFDDTITPTLILHLGLGYFHQREPNPSNPFDQTKIGLPGAGSVNAFPYSGTFPTIGGLNSGAGGFSPGIGAGFDATAWEQKPTANLNLTWVKGNHTYKFGGDMTLEGYITHNRWRANGNFNFAAQQTGNPFESTGVALNVGNPTGFSYASFLLGQANTMSLAQPTFTREGGKALGFFVQDNWKVTRKLTVEYGLRYDYQTYLREQHGRHASASFDTLNPAVGLKGAIVYEATCNCRQSSNYPFAFGPRLNASYQINEKTVFRAGFGVNYNVVASTAGNNFSVGDFWNINPPGYGITPLNLGLQGGNTYYKGNPYGNTEVVWPIFDPGRLPTRTPAGLTPESPFSLYHPNSRPGRIMQWSIGLQREVARNLVVEASYVGNRGAWFYSPLLDTMGMNSLAGGQLARYGLDITKQADRDLLGLAISSPQAAARGFFAPYNGFPGLQQVGQAIRPIPQWNTVNAYLGPNRGNTWYDSLQLQVTKRYSHNIDLSANVTYSHAMVLGASADTDFFFQGRPQVTDPFNRGINKQINQLNPPLKTVISGTYTTPGFSNRQGFTRVANILVKDWQIGAVMQYQSGQILTTPNSNNQLTTQLRINPAAGGGPAFNPWNYIPGSPFFRAGFDPNGDFDPRAYDPTNTAATSVLAGGVQALANGTQGCNVATCSWTNPAAGTWGTTSPYLEGFRWQRQPSESFNFGRNFRMGKENKILLNVRAEFSNIFNRMFFAAPATGNPLQAVTTQPQRGQNIPTAGYGVVNTFNGAGSRPRTGTLVARLTF